MECGLLRAPSFGMERSEQHNRDGKTDNARAEKGRDLTDSPGVAGSRPSQEILSATLHGSGSVFVVPVPSPPKSVSESAPETRRPGREMDGNQPHLRFPICRYSDRVVRIDELQARLSDDAALAKLLESIPLPHSVGPLLRKSFLGRKWDCRRQSDHWLASDGRTVVSLKISGASASAVARMRMRFDDLCIATPGLQPSRTTLCALLAAIAREDGRVAIFSVGGISGPE